MDHMILASASRGTALPLLAAALVACDAPKSATSLDPAGPPEVLQVFVYERTDDPDYALCPRSGRPACPQLAYGDHPSVPRDKDDRTVTSAIPGQTQRIRVVLDELLVGNHLQEIRCADGTWSRVPVGADPDDIAACAGSPDRIQATCTGPHAVCISPETGQPIGIQDFDLDGAVDEFRFINGAVRLICDGTDMPLELSRSFYQPSGNQLIPAEAGVDGLGPAIVLSLVRGLRTGSQCSIEFDPSVVDKDQNSVCAPAAGASCAPGVTDGITFSVEELRVLGTAPANGNTNVNYLDTQPIHISFNTQVNPRSGTVTITADGEPVAVEVVSVLPAAIVDVRVVDGYRPNTEYTVTLTGIDDTFGGTLLQPYTFTFATRMAPVDAAVPDAEIVDAAPPDAPVPDAAVPDAAVPDASPIDAGVPDAAP